MTPLHYLRSAAFIAAAALVAGCDGGSSSPSGDNAGAEQRVSIKRDDYGTPHVYANDTFGLFYGMGYAVAEDRLFQWEMLKRMGRGTAAEVLGKDMLVADTQARRDYDPASIQAQIDALPKSDRDILEGYAAGYNRRVAEVLENQKELLPKQFSELGFLPTRLTPLDIVGVHIRSIATNFSDSNGEVANLALLTALKQRYGNSVGEQVFDQLRWKNDTRATTTIAAEDQIALAGSVGSGKSLALEKSAGKPVASAKLLARAKQSEKEEIIIAGGLLQPVSAEAAQTERQLNTLRYGDYGPDHFPRASNVWLLDKSRVAEGHAVMFSGPQYGNSSPGNPYGIGLHGAGWNFVGSSSWGLPFANWGMNADIGWAVTVGFGDTTDMFQLTLAGDGATHYRHAGTTKEMSRRSERIDVKGGEPVTVEFLSTVYGQVSSFDTANGVAYAKKRTWDGKEVESLVSWARLSQARNWQEFLAQGKRMPLTMNWYYIDKENNIGEAFLGHFPIKAAGQDPRLPTPGDGSKDWAGIMPFEKVPKVLNPKSGHIINWNNKIQPNWDNADAVFWGQADRVDILDGIIRSKSRFNLAEIQNINIRASFTETNFSYFRPFIREAVRNEPNGTPLRVAAELLDQWDGVAWDPLQTGMYDSPAYTLFRTWLPKMIELTLKDDIPPEFWSQYEGASVVNPSMGAKVTLNALQGTQAGVQQDYDFFNGGDKYEVVREALRQTITNLEARYGADMKTWLTPVAPHQFVTTTFGGVPMNTPERAETLPVAMNRGTSNHLMMFPAGTAQYSDVLPPGQSAFIAPDGTRSPHYSDQLALYGDFRLKRSWLSDSDVDSHTQTSATLTYSREAPAAP